MDVRNCRQCGRLYNYIGGSMYNLCPDCIDKLEKKFTFVKEYIEQDENKNASIKQIAEDCDVTVKQLQQWIREERLTFSEDSPIGIPCEMCGKTIKSGKFCESCKQQMATNLGKMYRNEAPDPKPVRRKSERGKMRFRDD